MKRAFLFLSLLSLAAYTQSHGGRRDDPFEKFLKTRKSKSVETFDIQTEMTHDYSPVHVSSQYGLKDSDKIQMLPGQPLVNFSQYSGHVTVDPKAGRALFYYFAEAEDSSNKPLVLWLNGGPGCSSIGAGAMMENGPFRVNPDRKTLWYNEYAWNKAANVLFLESPAGVGFSYSNRTSDYITGDVKTASDSYTFLVNWFERFPEYKTRDFFITGESYAGHYVPQLANLIVENNKVTNQTVINLKGIAIGNAYIDYTDRWTGTYDHLWTSALMSDETHEGILKNCDFSSSKSPDTDACETYQDEVGAEIGGIDIYNIYAPLCGSNSTAPSISSFDPCSGDYATDYLNIPEVQSALHANITGIPGPWQTCNLDVVNRNWQDSPDTVLPVIKKLMASGINVWIYSGDIDGIIPVTTTRYSMAKIGAPVKTPWYPWYYQQEVGGYVVGYENVTFVTIRGAGHFVPSYQPGRALAFFSSFLEGKLPPNNLNTAVKSITCNSNTWTDDTFGATVVYALENMVLTTANVTDYSYYVVMVNEGTSAYGYSNCNSQLNKQDCTVCLDEAQLNLFNQCEFAIGAQVTMEDCSMRYENYKF